ASLLSWYRKLIALRRSNPALRSGHTVMLDPNNANVLTFARVTGDGHAVLVSLNMSGQTQTVTLELKPENKVQGSHLRTLLSSPGALPSVDMHTPVQLPPFAAWVAEVVAGPRDR
ncbi:MAG: DUF3459 domain-containing protein, partial [Sinobacteraceae bacterium]|nr:DUF3459 domain-containing protein [Nevskiaceae bacterium]